MEKIRIIVTCCAVFYSLIIQSSNIQDSLVIEGALSRTDLYIDLISDKKIGLVVNQSSIINHTHLVDTLISLDIDVVSIFSPEHGFKGSFEAGQEVNNNTYQDIPIYSLYGRNKKPSKSNFKNIEVIIFDLQDVGVRFYTYISTLHYVMEACAEYKVPLIVLDRYNPHIYHVDGPVLKHELASFIGMHPVPIIYGMTIGEYALMINKENWLKDSLICDLNIIPLSSLQISVNNQFFHSSENFFLKKPPSPNLKTTKSIKLYPTLCLFEGTPISIGRGTDHPFEIIGAPFFSLEDFRLLKSSKMFITSFTPRSRQESLSPKFENENCIGIDCQFVEELSIVGKINLDLFINIYNMYSQNSPFFNSFFKKLAGNSNLEFKISDGWSVKEIRQSWENDLRSFKKVREKYLIYSRGL